jgi:hypothetical protein
MLYDLRLHFPMFRKNVTSCFVCTHQIDLAVRTLFCQNACADRCMHIHGKQAVIVGEITPEYFDRHLKAAATLERLRRSLPVICLYCEKSDIENGRDGR